MGTRHFRIDGRVVAGTTLKPLRGLRVEAWDEDLIFDDFVGRTERTGDDGRFSIRIEESYFRGIFRERHPDLYFRVYRRDVLLARTGVLVHALGRHGDTNQAPLDETVVNVEIVVDEPASAVAHAVVPPQHRVVGCLRRADGALPAPAVVRAYAAAGSGRTLLGETLCDPIGRFVIAYVPPGTAPLSLVLQAIDHDGTVMGTASASVAPRPEEQLDIVLSEASVTPSGLPGRVVDRCRLDLPPDDVVEETEFERFFRLNLRYGDFLAGSTPAGGGGVGGTAPAPAAAPNPMDIRSLPLALYFPYTQTWQLQGCTRGRLVKSFALGPGEEQTVELFTWDRTRSSLESTLTLEQEQSGETSGSRRDTLDVARDVTRQTGFEMSTGGKVGFQVGVVNVDMKTDMSGRTAVNEAEKSTRSAIVEATARATQRVRTSRTLNVTESRESGSEQRVTRRLRNPNAHHTLTVAFFEILSNYRVSTRLRSAGVRLVVLIPSAQLAGLSGFDRSTVRTHETTLRLALLDRALAPGFDAARLLDARDRACAVLCQGCRCGDTAADTALPEWAAVVASTKTIAASVATIQSQQVIFPASIPAAEAGSAAGLTDVLRYLFRRSLKKNAPRLVTDLAALAIDATAGARLAQVTALHAVLAGLPADAVVKLRCDPEVSSAVWGEIRDWIWRTLPSGDPLSAAINYGIAGVRADEIKKKAGDFASSDDAGLVAALLAFGSAYDGWTKVQEAARLADEKKAELARIAKEEREVRILEVFGLRETAEAQERLQALLDHLNDARNADHYRFAVWNERSGASDDTIMSMALNGLIDPTPVGVVGEQLAVPVRLQANAGLEAFTQACLADLREQVQDDVHRHLLPSSALHCEAIVGDCSASEPESMAQQRLQTWRLAIDNQAAALEVRRLQARLDAVPALLDRDWPPAGSDAGTRAVVPTASVPS